MYTLCTEREGERERDATSTWRNRVCAYNKSRRARSVERSFALGARSQLRVYTNLAGGPTSLSLIFRSLKGAALPSRVLGMGKEKKSVTREARTARLAVGETA